jgi:phosphonopyruvate decarboxylase
MVPCSIFKPLTNWFLKNKVEAIFPPNEAHAMGFAVGAFCASGRPAVILLQNSGLGNITNSQTSLHALYRIPALLVVSWRGEKPEAPEHNLMGARQAKFLKVLDIPFEILGSKWQSQLKKMIALAKKTKKPVAVIVRKGFFQEEEYQAPDLAKKYPLSRFEAIKIIKETLKSKAVFISTNGHPSRDSFATLPSLDFYMMGSMGHAFSLGSGTAWQLGQKDSKLKTVVLDGDGGCLMHLGSLALVNLPGLKKSNLVYVVLDNEAYESTGSQPTLSPGINFPALARALGFLQVFKAKTHSQLKKALKSLKPNQAAFIHLKVNRRSSQTPRVSDHFTCPQILKRFSKTLR